MAVLMKKLKGVDMESLSNSATHLRGSGDYFDGQDQHHIYQEIFTPPSVSHHQRQDYMSLEEIRSSQNASGNKLKKLADNAHIHSKNQNFPSEIQ